MNYDFFTCDMVQAPHGRAPAVCDRAETRPSGECDFHLPGDGDLAAIGTAETVHAATRGENITSDFYQ